MHLDTTNTNLLVLGNGLTVALDYNEKTADIRVPFLGLEFNDGVLSINSSTEEVVLPNEEALKEHILSSQDGKRPLPSYFSNEALDFLEVSEAIYIKYHQSRFQKSYQAIDRDVATLLTTVDTYQNPSKDKVVSVTPEQAEETRLRQLKRLEGLIERTEQVTQPGLEKDLVDAKALLVEVQQLKTAK